MNKLKSDGFEQKQVGTGGTGVDTVQQCQHICDMKNSEMQDMDEPAKLSAGSMNSWSSSQTAKPVSVQDIGITNRLIGRHAVEQCMRKLEAGDAEAMCELARCCIYSCISSKTVQQIADSKPFKAKLYELAKNYAVGFAEPDNDSQAFQVFKWVEDQNDSDVLCAFGRSYNFGWEAEKDVVKAVEYYNKATDAASYDKMQRLSKCKNQNVNEQLRDVFKHFKQQADAGNANTQFAVAYCYYCGIGVTQSYQLALKMCQNAANQQNSNMMVLLGQMYEYGYGVEKNETKAVELYKQAADAGNREAQYCLGWCYYNADGVVQDRKQAVFWLEKAAAQTHAGAANSVGYCYQYGYGVEQDMIKAFQYYKQAAIAGNACGQYNAADCYRGGKGVQQSYERAAYWYQKAVDQGYFAQRELNQCLAQLRRARNSCKGISRVKVDLEKTLPAGTNQQHEIGFFLVKFAAELGCGSAFSCLGDCYFNGIGVGIDLTAAAKYYQRVEPSDSQILLNLVKCLQTGLLDGNNELNLFAALKQANTALRAEIDAFLARMR